MKGETDWAPGARGKIRPRQGRHRLKNLIERVAERGTDEKLRRWQVEGRVRREVLGRLLAPGHTDTVAAFGMLREEAEQWAEMFIEQMFPRCEHGHLRGAGKFCGICPPGLFISATDRLVVSLIEEGLDTEEIAEEMDLGRYTIRGKIRKLRRRFGGERMTDLPALVAALDSE